VDPFEIPDVEQVVRVAARLLVAAALGGALGYERGRRGKAAGLRTHLLVALSSALLVAAAEESGLGADGVSRVIQGVVTGIGFLGAGTILKAEAEARITGLTTAATIWFAAAVGVAVGTGRLWIPIAGVALALVATAILKTPGTTPGPRRETPRDAGER
jgi:putative Mg2+ transporter-C (MgtC) family protein